MKRKNKPLLNSRHPRQRVINELKKVNERGIEFPEYNPHPKRKEELKRSERKIVGHLKYKEWLRKRTKKKNTFVGWEYKDRQSYKKT